jgi:rhomboid protease GluP
MLVERTFKSNYLSKPHYKFGFITAVLMISLSVIVSLFAWNGQYDLFNDLKANQSIFESLEYWKLVTTIFVHGDIEHLLSNSLMLFILSYFVSAYYGAWSVLFLGLSMGAVTNGIVIKSYGTDIYLVGASGVIYYLWGFWLVLYSLINKQMHIMKRIVHIFGVFLILLVPTSYDPSTSYMAHYIGLLIGLVTGFFYYLMSYKLYPKYIKWDYKWVPEFESEEESKEFHLVD